MQKTGQGKQNRFYGGEDHLGRQKNLTAIKSLEFLQMSKNNNIRENHAIKAFNFVNNHCYKPLVDEPLIVNYIAQAISYCNQQSQKELQPERMQERMQKQKKGQSYSSSQNRYTSSKSQQRMRAIKQKQPVELLPKTSSNSPRAFQSQQQKKIRSKNLKFQNEREKISKLNDWVLQKMKEHSVLEKKTGSIITDRIHSLHLGFSEAARIAGNYSQQLSCTLINIHEQYHIMYENLVSCLMKHNLVLRKKESQLEQKVNTVIQHYEEQLLNVRLENEKKSQKVIQNFHKCIKIKQQLQCQNKILASKLKSETTKLKFLQESLTKAVQILLDIGEQKFKFLTIQQQKTLLSFDNNLHKAPTNFRLFHKWCSTILNHISNMKDRDSEGKNKKQKQQINQDQISKFAFTTIAKFMIDFDPTLSIRDAESILKNYHPQQEHSLKEEQGILENNIQRQSINDNEQSYELKANQAFMRFCDKNRSRQNAINSKVPNLHEICQKLRGVQKQCQATNIYEPQNKGVQTSGIDKAEVGVLTKPKTATKQASTYYWIRDKLQITQYPEYNLEIWGERQQRGPNPRNRQFSSQTVLRKMPEIQNDFRFDKVQKSGLEKGGKGKKGQSNIKGHQNLRTIGEQTYKKQIADQGKKVEFNTTKRNISSRNRGQREKNTQKKVVFQQDIEDKTNAQDKQLKRQQNYPQREKQIKLSVITLKENIKSNNQPSVCMSAKSLKNIQNLSDMVKFQAFTGSSDRTKSKSMGGINSIIQQPINPLKQSDLIVEDILAKRKSVKHEKYLQNLLPLFRNQHNQNHRNNQITVKLGIRGRHLEVQNVAKIKKGESEQSQIEGNEELIQTPSLKKQILLISLIKGQKKQQNKSNIATFSTSTRAFMVQFIFAAQERNKKITESVMWSHKKTQQIQKLAHKLHMSKERIMATTNNMQFLQNCIKIYIDPILNAYLKMYSRVVEVEKNSTSLSFYNQLMSGKKIGYYHRLSPLIYVFINLLSLNCFGIGRCTKYVTTFYRGVKNLKQFDRKLELYEILCEGTGVELDIVVKIIYCLSQGKSTVLMDQYVQLGVIQLQLFFILENYLTPGEINTLISQLRMKKKQFNNTESSKKNMKKSQPEAFSTNSLSQYQEKICLHFLTMKILKVIDTKKSNLLKKYKPLIQILKSVNGSITFNDLLYFIESFPTDRKTRKKILFHASFYLVYWESSEATIPIDRLVFLLQSLKFISNEALEKNLIVEYFKLKCQKEYRGLYEKVCNYPEYISDSVYRLFYRVPPMIHRLTQELRINRQNKNSAAILSVLYNMIIQDQIQKSYISGYLNALAGIPLIL